jgi:hypothetical protein
MGFGLRPLLRCAAALLLVAFACEVPVRTSRAVRADITTQLEPSAMLRQVRVEVYAAKKHVQHNASSFWISSEDCPPLRREKG